MTCNKERQSELACKLKVTAEKSESVFLRFAAGSEDLDSMSSHFDSKKTTVKMATMPCYQSSRTGQPARSIPMVPAHNNRDRYGFICDPAYFPAISYGNSPVNDLVWANARVSVFDGDRDSYVGICVVDWSFTIASNVF